MTRAQLHEFMHRHKYAVQASVSSDGRPQAAVVGIVVTEKLEIFFDVLVNSRKCQNLRRDPRIAFVIGWDEDQTVQYEGIADEPMGEELEQLKELYYAEFLDGRERGRLPDIAYVRAKPKWIRYSDYRLPAVKIVEFGEKELGTF